MTKNIYAVGDIHGMLNHLKRLLDKIELNSDDTIVFLGDYTDRGPDSFEVIDFLIKLKDYFNCIFLQGNHEELLYEYITGVNQNMFLSNGGEETIESYQRNGFDISEFTPPAKRTFPKSHAKFLDGLHLLYETSEYIFVHAGIKLTYIDDVWKYADSSKQDIESLLWSREFHRFGRTVYKGPKTVIFGHTPYDKVRFTSHAVCIDTGACYPNSGVLSCIRLPDKKIFQVE